MKKMYSTTEIARMLGLTTSAIRYKRRRGEIEGEKIEKPVNEGGEQYRYDRKEVIKLLEKQKGRVETELANLNAQIREINKSIEGIKEEY